MHFLVWLVVIAVVVVNLLRKNSGRGQAGSGRVEGRSGEGVPVLPEALREFAEQLGVELPKDALAAAFEVPKPVTERRGVPPVAARRPASIPPPTTQPSETMPSRPAARRDSDRLAAFYRAALGPGLCSPRRMARPSVPPTTRASSNR